MKIDDIVKTGIYKKDQVKKERFKCFIIPEYFSKTFTDFFQFDFEVDEFNKEIINQLYYYLNKSENFNGDVEKGIMLIGAIGCGKTAIMDSFVNIVEAYGSKVIEKIQSKEIAEIIIEKKTFYDKRPLYIDDVGKEAIEIINFGTVIRPIEDLLDTRYRNRSITFATSNFTFDDLQYNKHTKDRIKEMFNIIILKGNSRRK